MLHPPRQHTPRRTFPWWPAFILLVGLLGIGLYSLMPFPPEILSNDVAAEKLKPPYEGWCPGTCCFGLHVGDFSSTCKLCGKGGQIHGHRFCMKCAEPLGICLHCGRRPQPKPPSQDGTSD